MDDPFLDLSRRHVVRIIGGAAAATLLPLPMSAADSPNDIRMRVIPSTGEKIPVVGLGTWQVFDVGDSPNERGPLKEVRRRFVQLGGKVIDSSRMYGRAEAVIGDLADELHLREKLFLATKVWTNGKQAGSESMERSFQRFRVSRLDLMQVHNLVDVDTQLATMRAWKEQGR